MKISCNKCGKIHDKHFICTKRIYKKEIKEIEKFRGTKTWKNTRERVKERDKYLCQICFDKGIITYENLSVHHIVPMREDKKLWNDETNLITLRQSCHELAEKGEYSPQRLQKLIANKLDIPPGEDTHYFL